jgi:hypothetical protein
MPVSKKPRRAVKPDASQKAAAAGVLPDRRATESFLATIAGRNRDEAIARAQDVMYDAWEQTTSRSRIALARKAFRITPLCADAYSLLAEEAGLSSRPATFMPKASKPESWRSDPKGSTNMPGISGGFSKRDPICGQGPVLPALC